MKTNYILKLFLFSALFLVANVSIASEISGTINDGVFLTLAPSSSLPSGSYNEGQSVSLASAGADKIYYTQDGTNPTCSSGLLYKDYISIEKSQTIKAVSCYENSIKSNISEFSYTIQRASGGFSQTTRVNLIAQPIPEVLGASDEAPVDYCPAYINTFIVYGKKNDANSVKKLQTFLNNEMSSKLPITGFFGPLTRSNVIKFQNKYHDLILGKDYKGNGTGNVYQMTKTQINRIECSRLVQLNAKVK